MKKEFVHLHVHTQYSYLDGFGSASDYAENAKKIGQNYIGITDHGNVDGVIKFQSACKAKGIKPIIGVEGYIIKDLANKEALKNSERGHITILVENETGWVNLLKLMTRANLDGFHKRALFDYDSLLKNSEGLFIMTACGLSFMRFDHGMDFFKQLYRKMPDHLALEIMPIDLDLQNQQNSLVEKISRKYNLPVIATNDCHYVREDDNKAQEVLLAIQTQARWNDKDRWRFQVDGLYLKSYEEMAESFRVNSRLPKSLVEKALDNTTDLAEYLSSFTIEKKEVYLPKVPGFDGVDEITLFKRLVKKGWKEKLEGKGVFKKNSDILRYRRQVDEEVTQIINGNFVRYFLIVWELIDWSKKNKILVGPGRGCFAPDNIVNTSIGNKSIANIEVGEMVLVGPNRYETVYNKFDFTIDEELAILSIEDSIEIRCTLDHKILTDSGFKRARDIKAGDRIVYASLANEINKDHNREKESSSEHKNTEKTSAEEALNSKGRKIAEEEQQIPSRIHLPILQKEISGSGKEAVQSDGRGEMEAYLQQVYTKDSMQFSNLENEKFRITEDSSKQTRDESQAEKGSIKIDEKPSDKEDKIGCYKKRSYKFPASRSCQAKTGKTQGKNGEGYKLLVKIPAKAIRIRKAKWNLVPKLIRTILSVRLSMPRSESKKVQISNPLYRHQGERKSVPSRLFSWPVYHRNKRMERKRFKYLFKILSWNRLCKKAQDEILSLNSKRYTIDKLQLAEKTEIGICEKSSSFKLVKETRRERHKGKVYDLSVTGSHIYNINGCIVHNSCGGSLVAYLLNITNVDPLKYGLLFARFISPARIDLPDIDMDFEDVKRPLIRKHLEELYGEFNVAGVTTFQNMKGRSAVRDVSRVFDLPQSDVDKAAKSIVTRSGGDARADFSIEDAFKTFEDGKRFLEKYPDVAKLCMRLEGQIRGCVDGDAKVLMLNDFSSIKQVKVSKLWRQILVNGVAKIRAYDFEKGKFFFNTVNKVWSTGIKKTIKLTITNGIELILTPDHEVLTEDGWKPAERLSLGEKVATNGVPIGNVPWNKDLKGQQVAWNKGKKIGPSWNKGLTVKDHSSIKESRKRMIKNNPMLKEDARNSMAMKNTKHGLYSKNFKRMLIGKVCEVCGDKATQIHHKNKNREDNIPSNLQVLCSSCHSRLHNPKGVKVNHDLTILWSKVKSIKDAGYRKVYDISMTSDDVNFVCNKLVVHNSGTHAAAMIVSREDLRDGTRAALVRRKDGQTAINWDKEDGEYMGLMKLDVLGLSALTILNEARQMVKENQGVDIDFNTLPLDDPRCYEEFSNGNTVGCFQVGSLGLRRMCQELGIDNFELLVAATSLYRPGTLRCVAGNTLIRTWSGKDIRIDTIDRNRPIPSATYPEEKSHKYVKNFVGEIIRTGINKVYNVSDSDGNLIVCTKNHHFFVKDKGWLELKDIKKGDKVLIRNQNKNYNKKLAKAGAQTRFKQNDKPWNLGKKKKAYTPYTYVHSKQKPDIAKKALDNWKEKMFGDKDKWNRTVKKMTQTRKMQSKKKSFRSKISKAMLKYYRSNPHPNEKMAPVSRPQMYLYLRIKRYFSDAKLNKRVNTADGRFFFPDILIPSLKLIVEYDGAYWHKNPGEREEPRDTLLEAKGYRIIRVTHGTLKSFISNIKMLLPDNGLKFSSIKKIKYVGRKQTYDINTKNQNFPNYIANNFIVHNSGMTNEFIERKHGRSEYEHIHPIMEKITGNTYGIILYQEQVMQFMYELGGLGWKTSDTIRKVISKSQGVEKFMSFKDQFVDGCEEKGTLDRDTAGKLFDELVNFGCLTGDTKIYRASANQHKEIEMTIEEAFEYQEDSNFKFRGLKVLSMHHDGMVRYNTIKKIYNTGKKKVYRVKTTSHKTIRASSDHRFLIFDGHDRYWKQLKDIRIGDWITVSDLKKPTKLYGQGFGSGPHGEETPQHRKGEGSTNEEKNQKSKLMDKYSGQCQICGSIDRIEMHHIDGNHDHNNDSNTMLLCKKCHRNEIDPNLLKRFRIGYYSGMEEIVEIKEIGERQTYDIEMVEEPRNFIADNFVSHNSYGFNKCLTGDTIVYKPVSGRGKREITIKELYEYQSNKYFKKAGLQLMCFWDGYVIKYNKVKKVTYEGWKPVFKITTDSGKSIKATAEHRFLSMTIGDWAPVSDLKVGDKIACTDFEKFPEMYQIDPETRYERSDYKNLYYKVKTEKINCFCYWRKDDGTICGKVESEDSKMHYHHKDGWHQNHSPENLEWLCDEHHKAAHMRMNKNIYDPFAIGLKPTKEAIVKIEEMGIEEVYDVEMEDEPRNFIANGIVSHNSHAVEYSMITYWDCWMKVYYPAEFLACSLTYGHEDKTDELIEEALRLGLKIDLPKVGKSHASRWIAKDKVLYCPFSEIKGVGEKAAAAISEFQPEDKKKVNPGFFRETVKKRAVNSKIMRLLEEVKAFENKQVTEEEREALAPYFNFNLSTDPSRRFKRIIERISHHIKLDKIKSIEMSKSTTAYKYYFGNMTMIRFGYREAVDKGSSFGGVYGNFKDDSDFIMMVFNKNIYDKKKDTIEHCAGDWVLAHANHPNKGNIICNEAWFGRELLEGDLNGLPVDFREEARFSNKDLKLCGDCNFKDTSKAPVLSSPGKYNVMLIGEAPGRDEDIEGMGFVGDTGKKVVWPEFAKYGLTRDMFHITNVVKCYPGKAGKIEMKSSKPCWGWLEEEIEIIKPFLIFAMGNTNMGFFKKEDTGIMEMNGRTEWSDKYNCWICWSLHPSSVLYSPANREKWEDAVKNFAYKYECLSGLNKKEKKNEQVNTRRNKNRAK